jgi:hypothetical protein
MLAVRVVADVWRLYVPEQRLVDTAADYRNEEQVGAALRASGMPRELLFVVSKLGPLNQGFERATASVEASLSVLDGRMEQPTRLAARRSGCERRTAGVTARVARRA